MTDELLDEAGELATLDLLLEETTELLELLFELMDELVKTELATELDLLLDKDELSDELFKLDDELNADELIDDEILLLEEDARLEEATDEAAVLHTLPVIVGISVAPPFLST
jgi:hypothetical protein